MGKMIPAFTVTYTISVRYYPTPSGDQRCERILHANDELIASEDYDGSSTSGAIAKIVESINEINKLQPDKCTNCRYRIGDYTCDLGYVAYVFFKSRIRSQFLQFKYRLLHFSFKGHFCRNKPTVIHKTTEPACNRKND